jgi:hypothetical protein
MSNEFMEAAAALEKMYGVPVEKIMSEDLGFFEVDGETAQYEFADGSAVIISHIYGEPIYDDEVAGRGLIQFIPADYMSLERLDEVLDDGGFCDFIKTWCEEQHCTRVMLTGADISSAR